MPPKNRKNKNKKKEDDTPVDNNQDQETFKSATEEAKTEEVAETETTQAETTETTDLNSQREPTNQDESSQPQEVISHEEKVEVVPESEASQKVEVLEESQQPAEEVVAATEPEVAPVEQHTTEEIKPEETHTVVIESHEASHPVEEPVKEHAVVPEEPVHEIKEEVHVAPVSQPLAEPEEKAVEVPEPVVQHEEVHAVEEKVPEVPTDAEELKKVEELVQHGTTEPENVHLYASQPVEHNEVLTTSLQSNWEKFENQPPAQADLSTSQVVVENPNVHAVVESEGQGIAGQAGSLQESWNVVEDKSNKDVENKEKALEQEEMRSDKANDGALNTRLMDEYPGESVHVQKEIASVQVEAPLTHNDRLRRAEEHIRSAKALEEQGKYGEAVNLLQSSKDLLNPDYFQGSDQVILEEVNKQILDCTLEIATCYDQLSDFNQSVKYARAILKTSPGNIQAIYLLGIGLIRRGDLEEARVVLKEAKESSGSEEDNKYLALINKEVEKLEQIAESRTKVQRVSPLEEDLVVNREGSVNEKPQEVPEENKEKKNATGGASTEYFLGSLVSSSVLSFVIAKYILKFPTQRGIITSLVVGAVAGGVSLLAQRGDKTKKN